MKIEVQKYTGIDALHKANSFTTGHESKMSLKRAYTFGHSPIRTQRFYIYLYDIPLFVASQLVRSHVGVQMYQRSKRTDRGGDDFVQECKHMGADIQFTRDRVLVMVENGEELDEGAKNRLYGLEAISDTLCFGWPYRFDRLQPTDLMIDCNAEAIINMSHKRLCSKASKETREIWEQVIQEVAKVDPALVLFCVKPCVATGICREAKCCGFNKSELFNKQREIYKLNFIK